MISSFSYRSDSIFTGYFSRAFYEALLTYRMYLLKPRERERETTSVGIRIAFFLPTPSFDASDRDNSLARLEIEATTMFDLQRARFFFFFSSPIRLVNEIISSSSLILFSPNENSKRERVCGEKKEEEKNDIAKAEDR